MADRHLYQSCREPDCPRLACQAYRDGYAAGVADAQAAAAGS